VVTGASALAGLFLVYLGNVAVAFSAFPTEAQGAIRESYQLRGWLAFAGMVLAILSAGLALLGKWLHSVPLAAAAIVLLIAVLLLAGGIAYIAARDIR